MGRMHSRQARAQNLSDRFKQAAGKKKTAELERLRYTALKVLLYNQRLKRLSFDELFENINTSRDGMISKEELVGFFSSAEKNVKDIDVELNSAIEEEQPVGDSVTKEGEGTAEDRQPVSAKLSLVTAADKLVSLTDDG